MTPTQNNETRRYSTKGPSNYAVIPFFSFLPSLSRVPRNREKSPPVSAWASNPRLAFTLPSWKSSKPLENVYTAVLKSSWGPINNGPCLASVTLCLPVIPEHFSFSRFTRNHHPIQSAHDPWSYSANVSKLYPDVSRVPSTNRGKLLRV